VLPWPPVTRHLARARRALALPPGVLGRRLLDELRGELERVAGPRRARRFDERALLRATRSRSLAELWEQLAERPYPAVTDSAGARAVVDLLPGEEQRVRRLAEDAIARRVDLLGSGPTQLDRPVDWLSDFTTGLGWPGGSVRSIDYADLGRPSDVKVPWELSRFQWLIPTAQAYLLTGDERYPTAARELVDEWIAANPYAGTVNWAVAMETGLRLISWTYLFHVFSRSVAWSAAGFRGRFLRTLWLHAEFTSRHLERSHVNGNHYDANAAALVFAGLFFTGERASRWGREGWSILCDELPRQVTADGVDYEMATSYHRLVCELFLLPALYRLRQGRDVPRPYRERLGAMARFAAVYTRPDGSSPYWGDADDARVLPLGGQPLHDHRYLAGLVGSGLGCEAALEYADGSSAEAAWLLGAEAARGLSSRRGPAIRSVAFRDGGVYVLRGARDHVFVDCGPVGLAGRGGHGHNDCLSVDAMLEGAHVLTDCGSYVYTASPRWRERFRSTGFHNTPMIDGAEQNRPTESLWLLHDDAAPDVRAWLPSADTDILIAAHSGYRRLADPVTPERTVVLDRSRHALAVLDRFEGIGEHAVTVPFHLAIGVRAARADDASWILDAGGTGFRLVFDVAEAWQVEAEPGWVSPSYGVKHAIVRLRFSRSGPLLPLLVTIVPSVVEEPLRWARETLGSL
jgi:hypothetical protein